MLFHFPTKTRSIDYFISFFVECELLLSFVCSFFSVLFSLFDWCSVMLITNDQIGICLHDSQFVHYNAY